jgi:hypothetical protein
MSKALLLQFDSDPRCAERRSALQGAAVELAEAEPRWPAFFDAVRREQPAAIIIACSKIPSHALEAARYLSDGFNTRDIPLILVDVLPKDSDTARAVAPRATIADAGGLVNAVQACLKVRS